MINRTFHDPRLLPAQSYTVECAGHKANFDRGHEREIGNWIAGIWENEIFKSPAYIYKNIDWDADHLLYAVYECDPDEA